MQQRAALMLPQQQVIQDPGVREQIGFRCASRLVIAAMGRAVSADELAAVSHWL